MFPLAKAKRRSSLFLFKLFAKKGMSVKPKMGDALLFWNIKPDGSHYYRKHFPMRSKSVFRGGQQKRLRTNVTVNGVLTEVVWCPPR